MRHNQPLFPKNSWLGLRAFIFVLLSLFCMLGDSNSNTFFPELRSALSVVVAPVQYLVSWPIEFCDWVDDYFVSKHHLLRDNAALRANQLLLQAKVQMLVALEKENASLRALLSSASHLKAKLLAAQILAVNADPLDQQVVLDKGKKQGVYIGQPVLDANGVMGQVIAVGPMTSRVLLVSSTRSAVPVEDSRSGIRTIAVGQEPGNLQL
ncbi:MAG: rod shape-determining protein MreC, partial [Gammaproteobacteria bacterium]|nr:rod shape-determining protein MreC [Gammaproteobacteria bacterium]